MKTNALWVLAGVGAPMILARTADAGFDGIKAVAKPAKIDGQPALVVNVFATFDRPPQGGVPHDRFLDASGTPDSPMDIHVVGGTFYQHPAGTDTAPNAAVLPLFPSLAFDTFVTIGAKAIGAGYQNPPPLILTPGWPGFGPSSLSGTNLAWANTPDDPNTDPYNPAFVNGDGQVLIGQFTTLNGTGVVGMFRIVVFSNNVGMLIDVGFFYVPGPGALALLGTAGLASGRRRRRP